MHNLQLIKPLIVPELPAPNNAHLGRSWQSSRLIRRQDVLHVAYGFLARSMDVRSGGIEYFCELGNGVGVYALLVADDYDLVLKKCLPQSSDVGFCEGRYVENGHGCWKLDFCANLGGVADVRGQKFEGEPGGGRGGGWHDEDL